MPAIGITTALLFLSLFHLFQSETADYFWRDWNGTVPEEAFLAGTNNGEPIYVVQAYMTGRGLFIGYVQSNQTEVTINTDTSRENPVNVSSIMKVLCTRGDPFLWLTMDVDDLEPVLNTYDLYQAGYAEDMSMNPYIHVGRVNVSGNTYVGSIYWSYWLYYSNTTAGKLSTEYELLVMNNNATGRRETSD